MKYKLFVVAGTAVMEIAASNEFNDFKTLIEQLDLFGNEWDVTDHGETVLSSDQWPLWSNNNISNNNNMKKVIVRWSAVYETVIEVPEDATEEQNEDMSGDIKIDVPGSEYQSDTWQVERISSPEEKW